ncbi:MAG: type II toxin-antitoxin system CcdA family antitoxin [Maricaulaceae bacterium]|nr:type II toxin-antitoxin system CcdA family antitoxin [Maricaulaceae bacterium]
MPDDHPDARRRRVNLSLPGALIETARALDLNLSQAAEAGLAAAVKQARDAAWRRDNRAAIDAHNRRVEREGVLLTPPWAAGDPPAR